MLLAQFFCLLLFASSIALTHCPLQSFSSSSFDFSGKYWYVRARTARSFTGFSLPFPRFPWQLLFFLSSSEKEHLTKREAKFFLEFDSAAIREISSADIPNGCRAWEVCMGCRV